MLLFSLDLLNSILNPYFIIWTFLVDTGLIFLSSEPISCVVAVSSSLVCCFLSPAWSSSTLFFFSPSCFVLYVMRHTFSKDLSFFSVASWTTLNSVPNKTCCVPHFVMMVTNPKNQYSPTKEILNWMHPFSFEIFNIEHKFLWGRSFPPWWCCHSGVIFVTLVIHQLYSKTD